MNAGQPVLVQCKISRSAFSGERGFWLTTAVGEEYVGMAPVGYCYRADRTPVGPDEPAEGKRISGFVAGRVVANGGDVITVATPDGGAAQVSSKRTEVLIREEAEPRYVSFRS